MTQPPPVGPQLDPRQAATTAWVLWAALLMGQFMTLVATQLAFRAAPGAGGAGAAPASSGSQGFASLAPFLCAGLAAMVLPAVFLVRKKIFAAGVADGVLKPQAFLAGNLIFWAGCEGVALATIVLAAVTHTAVPTLFVALLPLGAFVLNRPNPTLLEKGAFAASENPYQPGSR